MKKYFVTGTDTDVGKTVVSAAMTLALEACYWKPIQSGLRDDDQVKELTQLHDKHFIPSNYSFKASLSPDQAAALEDITIDIEQCRLPVVSKSLVTEGAGGLFVPLNDKTCMIDLIQKLNLPVVIVTRGTLGTINHTLLTIEALQRRNIVIHGVVFNKQLHLDNQRAIEKWGNVRTLFHMPHLENMSSESFRAWVSENKTTIRDALS